MVLADMPGYGFAYAHERQREDWKGLVSHPLLLLMPVLRRPAEGGGGQVLLLFRLSTPFLGASRLAWVDCGRTRFGVGHAEGKCVCGGGVVVDGAGRVSLWFSYAALRGRWTFTIEALR